MANSKQAKKRAKQAIKRHLKNIHRKSAIKTAVKRVMDAILEKDASRAQELFKDAEAKIARAKGKRVLHANTAARRISRLAKRAAEVNKSA